MGKKLLVLVDGSYYMFRAYHVPSLQNFKNSRGEPTGAIYGVINSLRKLLNEFQPDYIAVVFDAKGKNFRHVLYPEYKANRPPMPEDLARQIEPIHKVIRTLGLPLLMIDGVEADDVIATLAKQAESKGMDTIISSGDKDLAQLVNDHIRMYNAMDNGIIDSEGVKKKYGVSPERIIDYLTLTGDSVDNVPGVPKVGPKTATKWLAEYGTLEEIVARANEFKGKVGDYLRESLTQLPLTRELVSLKCDVDLGIEADALVSSPPDREALKEQASHWEFKTLLFEFGKTSPTQEKSVTTTDECQYLTILSQKELDVWLQELNSAALIAFDTETTSLNYMDAEIVGLSFAASPDKAAYLPFAHDYVGAPKQLSRANVLKQFKPLLEDNTRQKVGHNLKYDMNVLVNHDIALQGCRHDTMLESYVLDSTATRHDMDSLALKYLGKTTIHYEDVAGKGSKQIPFNQVSIDKAAPYAAEDAEVTLKLHLSLWPKLSQTKSLQRLYEEIEIPLLPVLSRMERNGVVIDADMLAQQSRELTLRMKEIEQHAYSLAGQHFNIGSPNQIQTILFEKMNLPVHARTPKGQPSTAESVLEELALDYELPRLILDHRSLSKLKSTYTDKLPQQINTRTGRVHTSYHQAVAVTGRLSSSDPNLQNIPIRTEEGRRIRQAFIAPSGCSLLAADYSQIELRIMAHLSGDQHLLEAFAMGEDIHKMTAAEVFGVSLDSVSHEQRRAAKAINFGLIYGMSPFGLAKQLGIDRSEAKNYVDRYFDRYPGVKEFMDNTRDKAKKQGYVETIFKRRLYLPEINARNAARRQYAERTAINAPMQGSAADIIKRAMISVDAWLIKNKINAKLIMQVHDELVLEVAEDAVATVKHELSRIMSSAAELAVPLVVDIGNGENWDKAH
ncbi:MAG: DNA polymerase I [Gammaproteobacteria bacterium]|nr:DNA polymerase I [Gammaproteobacteria bacterium]